MSTEPCARPSSASSSYGGNPLAAAAALATLDTIAAEGLVEHAQRVGGLMLERLRAMQEKYEFIGDVRGLGLLIGLDLVKDRKSRVPLSAPVLERLFLELLRRGVLAMVYQPRVRLNPPLTISADEADAGLDILDDAFRCIADTVDYRA